MEYKRDQANIQADRDRVAIGLHRGAGCPWFVF